MGSSGTREETQERFPCFLMDGGVRDWDGNHRGKEFVEVCHDSYFGHAEFVDLGRFAAASAGTPMRRC